jgi:hypothetical protein
VGPTSGDHYSIMMGRENEIQFKDSNLSSATLNSYENVLFGRYNKVYLNGSTTESNFLFGDSNTIDTSIRSSSNAQTNHNYLFGSSNTINLTFNKYPDVSAQYNYIFGNTINLNKSVDVKYNLITG